MGRDVPEDPVQVTHLWKVRRYILKSMSLASSGLRTLGAAEIFPVSCTTALLKK